MTINHPTGSEEFAAQLEHLGAVTPWRLCDEEVGEILAADGGIACVVGDDTMPDEDRSALALWVVMAVNTLAGFRAENPLQPETECNVCYGAGFIGHGAGHGDVCPECGGQSAIATHS